MLLKKEKLTLQRVTQANIRLIIDGEHCVYIRDINLTQLLMPCLLGLTQLDLQKIVHNKDFATKTGIILKTEGALIEHQEIRT